jgi:hypothetical protein
MSDISAIAGLSVLYTNHCIRTTNLTELDNAGIEARHIMRVSGHKSEASIRSYACRLNESKKRQISHTLSSVIQGNTLDEDPDEVVPTKRRMSDNSTGAIPQTAVTLSGHASA